MLLQLFSANIKAANSIFFCGRSKYSRLMSHSDMQITNDKNILSKNNLNDLSGYRCAEVLCLVNDIYSGSFYEMTWCHNNNNFRKSVRQTIIITPI